MKITTPAFYDYKTTLPSNCYLPPVGQVQYNASMHPPEFPWIPTDTIDLYTAGLELTCKETYLSHQRKGDCFCVAYNFDIKKALSIT